MFIMMTSFYGCNKEKRMELYGFAQGTYYRVIYYDKHGINYKPQIDSVLASFDKSMSVYDTNSLVSRINHGDTNAKVDKYLADNMKIAHDVYLLSDGAFDVTGAPLFDYWGFGVEAVDSADIAAKLNNVDTLRKLLAVVGFDKVVYDTASGKIHFTTKGVRLNFNAMAQGYSVGVVSSFLNSKGLNGFLVDIGGEIYAKGTKPDGSLWEVGIEAPTTNNNDERIIDTVIKIRDKAIVTSGSYRKYFDVAGKRYSHIIDPRTGMPASSDLESVTVIHDNPAYADAWATAFMVMGEKEAESILSVHHEMTVIFK